LRKSFFLRNTFTLSPPFPLKGEGIQKSIFIIISQGCDYCMATIRKKIEKNLIFLSERGTHFTFRPAWKNRTGTFLNQKSTQSPFSKRRMSPKAL